MSNPTGVCGRTHVLAHLQDVRKKRGLGTRELARASGLSHTAIRRWEKLERCRAETAIRLAVALDARPEHLTGEWTQLPPE